MNFFRKDPFLEDVKKTYSKNEKLLNIPMTDFDKYLAQKWPVPKDVKFEQMNKFWNLLEENKEIKLMDKWAVSTNCKLLVCMNSLGSFVVGGLFRKQMNLVSVGSFSTFMPVIVGSTAAGVFFHLSYVMSNMLLKPNESHTRTIIESSAFHLLSSVGYPILFTSFSSIFFASLHSSFPIPKDIMLSRDSRKYIYSKVFRPVLVNKSIMALIAIQLAFAAVLTTFESKEIKNLFQKVIKQYDQANQ